MPTKTRKIRIPARLVKGQTGKPPHLASILALDVAGEDRDEGGRHLPFTDQAPEQIRDAEGDDEGVAAGTGTEEEPLQAVTRVPGDPAQEGDSRHGPGGTEPAVIVLHDPPTGNPSGSHWGPRGSADCRRIGAMGQAGVGLPNRRFDTDRD